MSLQSKTDYPCEWVKILDKGMITIPKVFRDQLGIKPGEVARIKTVGQRLVIEPREVVEFEVYSDQELKQMLEEDRLPKNLAKKASLRWPELE